MKVDETRAAELFDAERAPDRWSRVVALLEDPRAESRRMLRELEPWPGSLRRHFLTTPRERAAMPRAPARGRAKARDAVAVAA
jgi:hypothetical protein